MEYKHTQWGFIAIFVLPMVAVAVVPLVAGDEETTTFVIVATVAFMIALLALVLVFSRLEVTVSGGRIVAAFGFGRPRTVIELGDVTAVRQERNTWVQGWGSRKISRGWMYNVWGPRRGRDRALLRQGVSDRNRRSREPSRRDRTTDRAVAVWRKSPCERRAAGESGRSSDTRRAVGRGRRIARRARPGLSRLARGRTPPIVRSCSPSPA